MAATKNTPPRRTPGDTTAPDDDVSWEGLVLADNTTFASENEPLRGVSYERGTPLTELPEEHAMLARANPLLVAHDDAVRLAQEQDAAEAEKAPTKTA